MSEREEPKAIEGLRHSVFVLTGFGGDIPLGDVTVADMRDILAAYDALRSERDEARRERESLERELQDVRETYDRTIDHLNSDVTYERHRAERAERDGERLDLLQKLEERLTSIEIEYVAGEFWISEMCDDGATCLKTWRGFTIREAFDRALAMEGA